MGSLERIVTFYLPILATLVIVLCWWQGRRLTPTPPQPVPLETKPLRHYTTFRVQGVPLNWNSDQLQSFLSQYEPESFPVVKSLAPEIHGYSKTATVTFKTIRPETRSSGRIPLPIYPGSLPSCGRFLILDDNFHGVTTLFVPPVEDHKVDVIAVCGLGGHAYGSFKERGGSHMWLRDSLPHDLSIQDNGGGNARVITYGYNPTAADGKGPRSLEDIAASFRKTLLPLARNPRPIIFVGHSMGGLIIKQALTELSKTENEDDLRLLRAAYGLVFFGVPHLGADMAPLIPVARDGPNRMLLEALGNVSEEDIEAREQDFQTALGEEGDAEIVCVYETFASPFPKQETNGNWTTTGVVLVPESSAMHGRPSEQGTDHVCAVGRAHCDMAKFSPQDVDYQNTLERLRGLALRSLKARRTTG